MNKYLVIAICILTFSITAQEKKEKIAKFFIGINTIQNTYFGVLNEKPYAFSVNNNYAFSGDLGINYRRIIIALNYENGNFSENKADQKDHRNFLSKYSKYSASLSYKIPLGKGLSLVPGVGVSSWNTSVNTDTLNSTGKSYYYWKDGSIRNLPETYSNYLNPNVSYQKRDYNYETHLGNKTFISIPLKLAVNFDLSPRFSLYAGVCFNYVLSNNIDLMNSGVKNYILQNYFGASYVFMRKPDPDKMTKDQKAMYKRLSEQDTDGDGVVDFEDDCPTEGKEGKVDRRGCPDDNDNDGIIDSKDKEAKSAKHAVVDTEGKTIKPADPESAEEYNKSLDTRLETSKEEQKEAVYDEIEREEWPGLFTAPKFVDLNKEETQKVWNQKFTNLVPQKK